MACYHIQYDGSKGNYNCYRCDLCEKTWDWDDPHVKYVCKMGEEYKKCPIWRENS